MSKLYFHYGAMNSGKTTALLQVAHNYEEKGMKIVLIKPKTDTKGLNKVVSRLGVEREVDILLDSDKTIMECMKPEKPNAIIIDEAQFLTPKQVDELYFITKEYDIPVLCYGLRCDFQMKGFPGSTRLLEIADDIKELKTICKCGQKATQSLRTLNGVAVFEGNQVLIDGELDIKYEGVCGKCYIKYKKEVRVMYDEYINNKVKKHYDYLISLRLNVIGVFAQGSMNYGLFIDEEEYKSDVDTKAIVLPTLDDLISGNRMKSTKYDLDGEQIDVKDIRVMVDMWKKSNPAYLEILFTKYKVISPLYEKFINDIIKIGDDIVKMNFPQLAKCMSGMSKEKVIAMEHPYPSLLDKIEKFGYDPKQLHHIIRLNRLITEVFCCDIPFGEALEIDDERVKKYLINVKKGYLSLEQARANAIYYDNDTREIKEKVLENYKDFEFDSGTYNKLKNIVHQLVKYNIIEQIKKEI